MSSRVATEASIHHALRDIQHLGFDVDNSLVMYKAHAYGTLMFQHLLVYLVEHRACPREWLVVADVDRLISQAQTMQLDWIFDREHGLFVHINAQKEVCAVRRGMVDVDITDVASCPYANARILHDFTDHPCKRYMSLFTVFDLAYIAVLLHVTNQLHGQTWHTVHDNLQKAYGYLFAEPIEANPFLSAFCADIGTYIHSADEHAVQLAALRTLRDMHGKRLFIVSNSTTVLMERICAYALGKNYAELFDFQTSFAQKPHFWSASDDERKSRGHPSLPHTFAYVGDHLNSDLLALKKARPHCPVILCWATSLVPSIASSSAAIAPACSSSSASPSMLSWWRTQAHQTIDGHVTWPHELLTTTTVAVASPRDHC